MTLKILPKENSIFTNAGAASFANATQIANLPSNSVENLGINGSKKYREVAAFNSLETDKIITKEDASVFINLTEDAPGGPGTGYSALGTPASAVDIVCGRLTSSPIVTGKRWHLPWL